MADASAAGGTPEAPAGVPFTLDGRQVTAQPGEVIIAAAERAGTFIPRFCYHPRMKPVGMCRMCLVEVSGPRGATLQPACFLSVSEGMEVVTTSPKVKKAQDGILEFLLVNHPLDCPVCDKGGECPLQDQTLAYGPGESRFVEEKRHFEKPIAISDLVLLDRERCIQCGRCTRFAEEVAGEALIDFAGRGERVEVATFPDQPFSSYFSGNTVQICPVGALTATPYRFTARPWDLDQVESTCTTCAFGCRVAVQSSANRLTRLLGLDADPVNQGWLCDKGRFVFESVNGDERAAGPQPASVENEAVDVVPATAAQIAPVGVARGQFMGEAKESGVFERGRLTEPLVRKSGELVPVSWGEALATAATGLSTAARSGGAEAIALLGGARCTNEGAYAWAKLAKGVLGTDSVDAQLGDGLPAELVLGLPQATIDEACNAKTVVLLSGDVREELPVLFLRLRAAALEGKTKVLELAHLRSSLTHYATVSLLVRPGDSPEVVRALVDRGSNGPAPHPDGPAFPPETLEEARTLLGRGKQSAAHGGASEASDGEGVVVVLGRPSLAEHESVTAAAAVTLAAALPKARFLTALRRGNVRGALDMGLSPGLLPGRVTLESGKEWFSAAWGAVPAAKGLGASGILSSLAGGPKQGGSVRALILVGAEVTDEFPDGELAERAVRSADFVVAVAGHPSTLLDHAHVVLPVAVAHERPGTTTNIEGRVSRLSQKLVPPGLAWPDWMVAAELAFALGADLGIEGVADIFEEIERLAPAYRGLRPEVLDAEGGRDGLVVPIDRGAARGGTVWRAVIPIDPMAVPGVESAERQGAPPRVGLAGPQLDEAPGPGGTVPPVIDAPPEVPDPRVPAVDSYSLRLVSSRVLYDGGRAVAGSPSVVPLVPTAKLRAHPRDLDRLGAATGQAVRVRSARGALTMPATADASVPRGVVSITFNVPGPPQAGDEGPARNPAATLIDAGQMVTDVRLESL